MNRAGEVPKVLLDVSPVTARPENRTGLARVALSLGLALAARADLDISTCAWGSLLASDDFESVRREFPLLRGLSPRLSAWQRLCAYHSKRVGSRDVIRDAAWRMASQLTNRLRNPLAGIDPRRFDLVHSTYARIPHVVRRRKLPAVITVHDVMPLTLPVASLPRGQIGITRRILGSIRPEDWVVTVSEWTRADFLNATGHPSDRTIVIANGVDHEVFHPRVTAADQEKIRSRFGLGSRPFLLTLSSLAPHKNLRFLLQAWEHSGVAETGAVLVLAGGRTVDAGAVPKILGIESAPAGILLTGFIRDEEFRALASDCHAFLFPSLYEGFGLPVLEAMACGAPAIASNCTSIPEVVGDAGLLLDPTDVEAWIAAIRAAFLADRRGGPNARAVHQAARFSWSRVAAEYAALYRRLLA